MTNALFTRRDALRIAAGCGLSFALPALDVRAADQRGVERPRSLIIVWLDGGPSQLETWDPHPGGPIGGPTQAIDTPIAGASIAADFPRVAEQLTRLSIVRSLVSKEGDHARGAYAVKTGYRPDPVLRHPALGAILARELPNDKLEIPAFITLGYDPFPSRGGYLGNRFDAFQVRDAEEAGERKDGPDPRRERRLAHLDLLSKSFARGRQTAVADTLHAEQVQTADKMMTSEHLAAFRAAEEPAEVRAAYGETGVGRACLIARRLIETGVRVVEVVHSYYDTHQDNFHSTRRLAAELDPALGALVADLAARDLFESTIVLCLGEFGRTPQINQDDGRDHWPTGFSCLLGGGGLRGGIVIGATDPLGQATEPTEPKSIGDLYATVLKACGIDPKREVITPIARPLKLSEGQPIPQLIT